ncbi:helix-turn-helix domain-containing protein [Olivibacter sp. CPCC 100613]|uniref:helix-turn-helix transcriptional regulator n=1 Tax=Olivibacter sp. CPCC 100613 TaxID=3079931 RepID=UPI002FFBAFD6
MEKKFLDTKELLEILNIGETTLVRYKKKGLIPYLKMGGIHRYDLDKVVSALEVNNKQKQ